jgi:hypothetical protein
MDPTSMMNKGLEADEREHQRQLFARSEIACGIHQIPIFHFSQRLNQAFQVLPTK